MSIFIIPGNFSSYRSLADKTLRLVFDTQEPDPETVAKVQQNIQTPGFLVFKQDKFMTREIQEIEKLKLESAETSKSQAQRIRAVLYKLFEQNNMGFVDFEGFYKHHTEKYIEQLKSKLL